MSFTEVIVDQTHHWDVVVVGYLEDTRPKGSQRVSMGSFVHDTVGIISFGVGIDGLAALNSSTNIFFDLFKVATVTVWELDMIFPRLIDIGHEFPKEAKLFSRL